MKTPFSIKLIYWIVIALFWFITFGLIVQIGNQLLYKFSITESAFFTFTMPLRTDLLPITEVVIDGVSTPFTVVKIIGGFDVWDLDIMFAIIKTTTFYAMALLFLYALSLVKKMILNVKKNEVFVFKNVVYLKQVAYVFFAIWVLKDVIMLNYIKYLFANFEPYKNLFIESWLSNYLLIASITLAVAYIFERGVKLQREQNLTI